MFCQLIYKRVFVITCYRQQKRIVTFKCDLNRSTMQERLCTESHKGHFQVKIKRLRQQEGEGIETIHLVQE